MKKTHVFLLVGATCIILLGGLWGAGIVQIGPKAEKEPSSDPMNQPSSDPTKQTDKQAEDKKPKDLNVGMSEPKYFVNSIGMKFVWIPPGSFLMGSPLNEEGRGGGEIQHRVTLTKGFFMGVHTVTQKEWRTVMGNNPSNFKGEKHLPVERVSWNDCQEFANKLREKDKKMYRLPSEAEWEYACRAGTKTPFHFGDTIAPDQANYNCNFIYGTGKKGSFREKTTPVGSFPANAWGLHDMHGNVWEWCQDWYGDYPTKDLVDPQGADNGKERVLRGGSWFHRPENCRSALRFKYEPGFRSFDFGFRLCFFVDESDKSEIAKQEKEKREADERQAAAKKEAEKGLPGRDPPKTFTNSIGMKFVWIPPGSFVMGSPKEEKFRETFGLDETQHNVTLTKGFYMGVYTVTQEQWQTVMGSNPSRFKTAKNHPVENISWHDCQVFIKKLREMDKNLYRLPSEAEWEYACRAGTKSPYCFGETISTEQANFSGKEVFDDPRKGVWKQQTTPVGKFPANAWGLYDMHGNVFEWCQDRFGNYPREDVVDPTGPKAGDKRILRGGSWYYLPHACRSARRFSLTPDDTSHNCGLRLCFFVDESVKK